jgi:DNA-binding MarR family transcriptional regulator
MSDRKIKPSWPSAPAVPDSIVPHRVPFPLSRCFQQICATVIAETFADEQITAPMQYPALACIHDSPGIDQARLATLLSMDRASTGTLVDELERRGLLERRINGADRRARELYLTPNGVRLRRRLRPKLLAAQERVLSVLKPAEQDQLIGLLTRVIEANAEHVRPGAGRRRPSRSNAAKKEEDHEQ